MPEDRPPSYGGADPVPPPYSPTHGHYNREECQETHTYHCELNLSPSRRVRAITWITWCFAVLLLLLVPSLVVNIYLSDLPTKISRWNEATTRMREQENAMNIEAKHLESERVALQAESTRLENERRSLEKEKLALKEERERWEKARDELTIPRGAFWEVVWPAWDCRAYGQREYWGILRNIPAGRSEVEACMNMPVVIRGVTIRRPHRCQHVRGSIHGFWLVDWDQPDCKPWLQDFTDRVSLRCSILFASPYPPRLTNTCSKGCTNWGSGLRRIEAEVMGINGKGGQDWRLLCETTPMIWNHTTYTSPTHCEVGISHSPTVFPPMLTVFYHTGSRKENRSVGRFR